MPAKNLRFERIKKKEDMLRRKQSQRELRKLMSIRGYWTKEANLRHQNLIENPVTVISDEPNLKKYEIKNIDSKSIESFLKTNKNRTLDLMEIGTKIQFNLQIDVEKEDADGVKTADWYLIKPYSPALKPRELRKMYNSLTEFLNMKLSEMESRESGWRLKKIKKLIISIVPFTSEKGGCLKSGRLPKKLQNKEIFPIIKSHKDECLKWSIVYYFMGGDNGKITKEHEKKAEEFDWKNISFPADKSDMKKFEKNNPEYLIYCYGYIGKKFYIHYSNKNYRDLEKSRETIHLLLYNNHYFPIMNLRSFNTLLYGTKNLYFGCKSCMYNFSSQEKLDEHYNYCGKEFKTKVKMPKKGEFIKFKNYKFTEKVPYICYWDSESMLEPIEIKNGKTTKYQQHKGMRFGLLFVNSIERKKEYFQFDNPKDFVAKILELGELYKKMVPLKDEERKKGERKLIKTKRCENCKSNLDGKGVMDHCHFTGKFRKILCNNCNLKFVKPNFLPVVCHNFCGYDEKLIIRELRIKGVDIIAKNIENFICITLTKDNVRFIDSYKFLQSSLANLVENLLDKGKENFFYTRENFADEEQFNLCLKKGVFPYSYFNSEKVLKETSLPPKEKFYNELTGEHISDEEYEHAKKVWRIFGCKTFEDYLALYLKMDCFQLCDVFDQFREKIMEIYDLDPAHYFTISSLAFDCLLKYSGVNLEVISDPTIYNFFEKSIRGGVSMSVKRFAKSNNKYQEDYNPEVESSYIPYLDANGLYSAAMCKKLPVSGFEWGDPEKWREYKYCHIDVDVFLPEEKWDYFSDYPLCPTHEFDKLVCTFSPKEHFICSKKYLETILEKGYKIKKVNKVLKYKAKAWIKDYIAKNTELRTKATSKFEKDLWKLMNNIVYGKQIENVRNRVNIKYCTNENVRKEYRKQTFKGVMDLSEDIFLIEHMRAEVFLNKPIYGGATILDYSKITMIEFFYDYLKPKFGKNVELLYTDTDSFILQVFCDDFYKEISEDVDKWFDTSAYEPFNCLDGTVFPVGKNKKVPAKFKDECGDSQIKMHLGLRSKVYINEKVSGKTDKKCKGITKKIMKDIVAEDYFSALNESKIKYGKMDIIRSHKHTLYTERIEKKVLDPYDEKRRILSDGINTFPWF